MSKFAISFSALFLAACLHPAAAGAEPVEQPEWRNVAPENLLIISVADGDIIVELNPDFAPNHVQRIRELSASGVYDGAEFYRVIESFVAQGGLKDDDQIAPFPALTNENDRPIHSAPEGHFIPLGNADLFTPVVGHIDGFAVGQDETLAQEWLLHCPGAMAMARDEGPDTGSTEFYIVLDAQRYLDRNLTVFGRVLSGMEHVQAFKRGIREIESGVIQAPDKGETMLSVRTADQLDPAVRPVWEVMNTQSEAFEAFKTSKRVRTEAFFYRTPPEVLDICSFSTPARKKPATAD